MRPRISSRYVELLTRMKSQFDSAQSEEAMLALLVSRERPFYKIVEAYKARPSLELIEERVLTVWRLARDARECAEDWREENAILEGRPYCRIRPWRRALQLRTHGLSR
jgi:hypothetical protein